MKTREQKLKDLNSKIEILSGINPSASPALLEAIKKRDALEKEIKSERQNEE